MEELKFGMGSPTKLSTESVDISLFSDLTPVNDRKKSLHIFKNSGDSLPVTTTTNNNNNNVSKPTSEKPFSFVDSESRRLKKMLLSELELIQRRTETIVSKDRRLRELRKENDLLQNRLASMEGRRRKSKDQCLASFLELGGFTHRSKKTRVLTEVAQTLRSQPPRLLEPSGKIAETSEPYYTFRGQPFVLSEKNEIRNIVRHSSEVPAWRIHAIPRAYSMEGTENIEDENLLKRHAKPEMDEIKRKKWHVQRLRQLQECQKLRAPENKVRKKKKGRPPSSSIHTLYSIDVTHICVTDSIPVNAFGVPLPLLPSKSFSLNWSID